MYIRLTENNRDKTAVRGAKFENGNLMCTKSTYVLHNVRVMCIMFYNMLSFIYFKNTLPVVVSPSTAAATGYAAESRFQCDKAAVLGDKIQ